MIDLNKLSTEAYIIAKKRELNGAKIKADAISMLKHCASEERLMEIKEKYKNGVIMNILKEFVRG